MNPSRLFRGTGEPLMQNIFDYGSAAALGVAGQQAMNIVSGGADPNPFISGALMAPLGAYGLRQGRAKLFSGNPSGGSVNRNLAEGMLDNPYSQAALYGSGASLAGGIGTSAYNTIAGGDDIDNNNAALLLAALGSIAPITMGMMNNRATKLIGNYGQGEAPVSGPIGSMGTSATGNNRYDVYGVPKDYGRDTSRSANQQPYKGGGYYAPTSPSQPQPQSRPRPQTVDVPVDVRPNILGALPYQRGGGLTVRDSNLPTSSRVSVPPLSRTVLRDTLSPDSFINEIQNDIGSQYPYETALRGSYMNTPTEVRRYIQ